MLTRFRFDSGRVARKGFVGTVTVKQASGQPDKNPQDARDDRALDMTVSLWRTLAGADASKPAI